ncbi:hypothetical protein Q9R29_09295 [Rothia sp. ARF10]|nr:hypothetical protein [Rothia sp. ARF10]
MQTHSARGHGWTLTLLGESLSLVRLMPSRLGQSAAGSWTQRVMPVSTVRQVEVSPPHLLRRGRLTLHFDEPSRQGHDVETIHFDRKQLQAVSDLAAALKDRIPPVHANRVHVPR